MPVFDLGTLTIVSHEAESLVEAFGIPPQRLDPIIELCYEAWRHEDTISESIEYLAQRVHSSELVLALVTFGRIWEESENASSGNEEAPESTDDGKPKFGY
ncbi:MAG: hypothetical protein ACXAEF_09085 [Candidatus Thorarchaeota archaeon]|jgi:hypothetical protein